MQVLNSPFKCILIIVLKLENYVKCLICSYSVRVKFVMFVARWFVLQLPTLLLYCVK